MGQLLSGWKTEAIVNVVLLLFIVLCKVVLFFESEMKCFSVAIYKKDSTERYYSGVLFVMV